MKERFGNPATTPLDNTQINVPGDSAGSKAGGNGAQLNRGSSRNEERKGQRQILGAGEDVQYRHNNWSRVGEAWKGGLQREEASDSEP